LRRLHAAVTNKLPDFVRQDVADNAKSSSRESLLCSWYQYKVSYQFGGTGAFHGAHPIFGFALFKRSGGDPFFTSKPILNRRFLNRFKVQSLRIALKLS